MLEVTTVDLALLSLSSALAGTALAMWAMGSDQRDADEGWFRACAHASVSKAALARLDRAEAEAAVNEASAELESHFGICTDGEPVLQLPESYDGERQ